MDDIKAKCLIDRGCSTSIINSKRVANHRNHKLDTQIVISSVNDNSLATEGFLTSFPEEFDLNEGIEWKLVLLEDRDFDAIIGQNVLVPTKTNLSISMIIVW
ncbi:unnamed protein product [Hermetia illucens]|uniref:Uncharacterized protein n=1 Tax=Hermetia illucens TaxID=343691 RepID=A0A7R8UVV9_HERIL|nr:unnamed protein product [Hermetia illucens]